MKKKYGQTKKLAQYTAPKQMASITPKQGTPKLPVKKPGIQPVKKPVQYPSIQPVIPRPNKRPLTPSVPIKQPSSAVSIGDEMKRLVPSDIKKKSDLAKKALRRKKVSRY